MAKKKNMGNKAVVWLLTALFTGALMFLFGLVFETLRSPLGEWYAIALGVIGLLIFSIGQAMRKGKETFLNALPTVVTIGIVFQLLDKVPFNIPYIQFAVEWSIEGLVLLLGTVWTAEALVQWVMKQF